ncbi:MAG: ABC transporter permease [Promethearchaeota archaeon]
MQPISGQAIYVVLLRELKRFWRARARIIASIAQSFFFLLILGFGIGGLFGGAMGGSYLTYIAPGIIAMSLLFASVFSGVSVIFDRQFGFFKEMLVAPVSRTSIITGKIFGGAITAVIQGLLILVVSAVLGAFLLDLRFAIGILAGIGVMLLITAGFVGLGVAIGSALTDFHAFQLISTFIIWPLFMLSGVFFPIDTAPIPLQVVMLADPLFYGVELLRFCLVGYITPILGPWGPFIALGVLGGFSLLMIAIGTYLFSRAEA